MSRAQRERERANRRLAQSTLARSSEQTRAAVIAEGARPLSVTDRFGRALQVGDEVLYTPEIPLVFVVADVKPIDTHPGVPPGTIALILQGEVQLPCRRGQAHIQLALVNRPAPASPAEETVADPAHAQMDDDGAPPADVPDAPIEPAPAPAAEEGTDRGPSPIILP